MTMFLLQMVYLVSLLITEGCCVSCPMILYKIYFYAVERYVDFLHCETECCGTSQRRICCEKPEVQQQQQQQHNIGVFIGIGSACVVLIVSIILVTRCCIIRQNKNKSADKKAKQEGNTKNKLSGIDKNLTRGQGTKAWSVKDQNPNTYGTPPPTYESCNHLIASAPKNAGLHYLGGGGKARFQTGHM